MIIFLGNSPPFPLLEVVAFSFPVKEKMKKREKERRLERERGFDTERKKEKKRPLGGQRRLTLIFIVRRGVLTCAVINLFHRVWFRVGAIQGRVFLRSGGGGEGSAVRVPRGAEMLTRRVDFITPS